MSAKMSKTRRAAFLKALAETGNQTLSAERAKVSRSWVCLQRSGDAGFDAVCLEAIAAAKARLIAEAEVAPHAPHSPHPARASRESPSPARGRGAKWQFAAGVELVVSGTNGVRTQVRRARLRQWTPRVEARFLSALSASCNARAACAAVGLSVSSAYARRERLPAFARAWEEAVAIGKVRLDAVLIQNLDYAFDPAAAPPEMMLREVTVTDLIRTLRMYEKRGR
jgi:hypothetical protein